MAETGVAETSVAETGTAETGTAETGTAETGEVRPAGRAAVRTTARAIAETSTTGADAARRTVGLCENDWAFRLTSMGPCEEGRAPVDERMSAEDRGEAASMHPSGDDRDPSVVMATCFAPTEIMVPSAEETSFAEEVSVLPAQASYPRTAYRGATRTRTPASRSGR